MYKWFLNRGPNCATQNHNTQGRPNGHLRSHPTQSPRARDTHPLDQRSQLTVEPPDGLGGGVIINAEVFRDRVHGNATSAHLSRVRSDPLVHRHRGRPDEVHLDGQPGQGANVFLPGPQTRSSRRTTKPRRPPVTTLPRPPQRGERRGRGRPLACRDAGPLPEGLLVNGQWEAPDSARWSTTTCRGSGLGIVCKSQSGRACAEPASRP